MLKVSILITQNTEHGTQNTEHGTSNRNKMTVIRLLFRGGYLGVAWGLRGG